MLEFSTIVFMVLILGSIWGGLIYLISRAQKGEKSRATGDD